MFKIGFLIFLGLGFFPTRGWAQKAAPSTNYSLTIKSNARQATIMRDGLVVGRVGQAFDASPGYNRVHIGAPGYAARWVVFWLSRKTPKATREANLARTKRGSLSRNEYPQATKIPNMDTRPSYCKPFGRPCQRVTLGQDVAFADWSWRRLMDAKGLSGRFLELTKQLRVKDHLKSPQDVARLEGIYSVNPEHPLPALLLAESAIQRGDCQRVWQIAEEYSEHDDGGPPELRVYGGLCHEMTGSTDKAIAAFKSVRGKIPEADFHAARAAMQLGGPKQAIIKDLKQCVKQFAAYYPCHEVLSDAMAEQGDKLGAQKQLFEAQKIMDGELKRFLQRSNVEPENWQSLYWSIPYSFEAAASYFSTSLSQGRVPQSYIEQLMPYWSISRRNYIVKIIRMIEKDAPPAIKIRALRHIVRTFPKEKAYWGMLVNSAKEAFGCDAAMKELKVAPERIQRQSATLLSLKGDCQMNAQDVVGATQTFRRLIVVVPTSWKAHWNLGLSLQAQKKYAEALASFETTLEMEPPANRVESLTTVIEFLKSKVPQKTENP
jgi:tetratricopeptide (TPR) repeat protein